VLTGTTGQHTAFFVGPVAEADTQIVEATLVVVRAFRVLTAEGFQVVHEAIHHPMSLQKKVVRQLPLP
jgi:hypothetical protein